jgi:hypothetical protein
VAKSTKALLTGRIQKCKTNPSIAHIGLATHGRSIQIGSSNRGDFDLDVDIEGLAQDLKVLEPWETLEL